MTTDSSNSHFLTHTNTKGIQRRENTELGRNLLPLWHQRQKKKNGAVSLASVRDWEKIRSKKQSQDGDIT